MELLNSNLENWRFSLTSTNNNVGTNEIEMLPYPKNLSSKQVGEIAELVKQLQSLDIEDAQRSVLQVQQSLFDKLNHKIYSLFGLTEEEIRIVEGK